MKEEEINKRIAEACGWKQSERSIAHWHHVSEPYSHMLFRDLPNYCADLNAMHKAENVLDGVHSWNGEEHHCNAKEAYMGHLTDIIVRNSGQKISDDWQLVCATARQRAEAFLRTLGKWNQSGERTEMEVQK